MRLRPLRLKTQRRGRLREFRFRIKDATQKLHCTRRSTRMASNYIGAILEWLRNTTDTVKKRIVLSDRDIPRTSATHPTLG